MRQILVDHARARQAAKRGAKPIQVTLTEGAVVVEPSFDLLALDEALKRMETFDERQVRIVEMRFLAGLSVEETADLLEISTATVKRETAFAKAWLARELSASTRGG
jgi:RNA polymerase sigma factor (TIGR02999 family)